MIEAICCQSFKSRNFFNNNSIQKDAGISALPAQSPVLVPYSLHNLKASYMPVKPDKEISFCGNKDSAKKTLSTKKTPNKKSTDDVIKQVVKENVGEDITRLSANRIKGNFYADFSNDLAIVLRTNRHAILEMDPGVDPEIFVHNFTTHLQATEKAQQASHKTKVIYIEDPDMAVAANTTGEITRQSFKKPEAKDTKVFNRK